MWMLLLLLHNYPEYSSWCWPAENFPYFSEQRFFFFVGFFSLPFERQWRCAARDSMAGPAEPLVSRETLCRGRQKCAVKACFMGNQSKCRWCRYSAAIRLRNQHLLQIDVLREKNWVECGRIACAAMGGWCELWPLRANRMCWGN